MSPDKTSDYSSIGKALSMNMPSVDGVIPIKAEHGRGIISYKAGESTVNYTINFTAKQPRITSFNKIMTEKSGNAAGLTGYDDLGITYISGAAVNNDNGSIINSITLNGSSGTAVDARLWALANVHPSLVGASMFMMPAEQMVASGSYSRTNLTAEFFNFTAEYPCTVTVLLAQAATADSVYLTADSGWACVNNGDDMAGTVAAIGSETPQPPRTFNNFSEIGAIAYQWRAQGRSMGESNTYVKYRSGNPGLTEDLTSTHVDLSAKLKYVYQKSFDAGETINIYNPGSITNVEQTAVMPVMVQYYIPDSIAGKVIDEDFEEQVSTNPNYSIAGGWELDGTAGSDTGYSGSGEALCVGYAPGKTLTAGVEVTSEYYLPISYASQTGLVYFKFDFFKGEKTNNTKLYLSSSNQYNSSTNVELTDLSNTNTANCDIGVWYNIEILVDLDKNNYTLSVFNSDGSLKYEKTGEYNEETVRYISFGTTASNNWAGQYNISGYATKIDNFEVHTHYNQSLIDLQESGDNFTANAEFYSCSWKSNSYLILLAAYSSDGELLAIKDLEYLSPVALQDGKINQALSMPSVDNATKYKAFLWYDDRTPACSAEEIDL